MRITDLPNDLLIPILVRLPLECLGRFRCVLKSWNALISSQEFIKPHLNQTFRCVLLFEKDQIHITQFSSTGENMDLDCNLKRLHCLPEILGERIIRNIVGSSNGLLCLLLSPKDSEYGFEEFEFALCNPLTKATWDLPGYKWKRLFNHDSQYSFGYDDNKDDYKVFLVNNIFRNRIHEREFHVYSLRSNSWSIRIRAPCNFDKANHHQFIGSLVQPYPPSVVYEKIFSVKNFEDFHIHVNGVCIDSELHEDVRRKYYDLCCSKKLFLHKVFVPGLSLKVAVSMIVEVVNIVDSIRSCNSLATSEDEYEKWENSLRSLEPLGLNVGFLRDRIRWLSIISFDSKKAIEAGNYGEVISKMS